MLDCLFEVVCRRFKRLNQLHRFPRRQGFQQVGAHLIVAIGPLPVMCVRFSAPKDFDYRGGAANHPHRDGQVPQLFEPPRSPLTLQEHAFSRNFKP
jgi:hypothetical protein